MKNPLEYTLLEIEALMREAGETAPEFEFTALVRWIHERQKYLKEYQVQREREISKAEEQVISKRAAERLERELLDSAPVEFVNL